MDSPDFFSRKQLTVAAVADFGKVRVLGLVSFFIGPDGPLAEVADLLVDVISNLTGCVASLRLENANGFTLALGRAPLPIHCLHIFVEEDHGARVFGVVRSFGLCSVEPPLRHCAVFAKQAGMRRCCRAKSENDRGNTNRQRRQDV